MVTGSYVVKWNEINHQWAIATRYCDNLEVLVLHSSDAIEANDTYMIVVIIKSQITTRCDIYYVQSVCLCLAMGITQIRNIMLEEQILGHKK